MQQLKKIIDKSRLIDDPLLRYAYATDASMYRLIPWLVVIIETVEEVQQVIILANTYNIPLTFRAAGTSLSGQAVTDQVLVVLSNNTWNNYIIHNQGRQIALQPGIVGAHANLLLKPYNTKIGPDPASIGSCKIGGIVANNSSGMCCGVAQNTYQTMQSLKFILANGSTLDTADEASRHQFIADNPLLINGIKQLYQQVHSDPELVSLIRHKFKIKNTSGYSLNAFIDYADPIDIIAHLMVGSEGTLGFISEITYNCVPVNPYTAVSLIYCSDIEEIIQLALAFKDIAIDAIELLDITSLLAVKTVDNHVSYLPDTLANDTSAMLVEVSATSISKLNQKITLLQEIINQGAVSYQVPFTTDTLIRQHLWDIRKGILPIIGSTRPPASTVIIEDIAVAITDLPELISHLRKLFIRYNYSNVAVIGHILAGNIHFIFTPSLTTAEEINNYDNFMQEVSQLVAIKHKGSLKAEHGCGRNMAAFIELEWGKAAYSLMWQIKELIDPNNILNPGVILSQDPKIHLKNLKQLSITHPQIDKCIECGFCESICPSRKITLTPRQRISTYRYMNSLKAKNKKLYSQLSNKYQYYGINTCATTGMCATTCPVDIDTGKFILELKESPNKRLNTFWANHFALFIHFNRKLLSLTNLISKVWGNKTTATISAKLHRTIPLIPVYPENMPQVQPSKFNNTTPLLEKRIVYIPSCNNRIFADSKPTNPNVVHQLLEHLGYSVIYPPQLAELCCGQVFESDGNPKLGQEKKADLTQFISTSPYPVLVDNSSCYKNLSECIPMVSLVDIINDNLGLLKIKIKYARLAVHIDCSTKKLGQEQQLLKILKYVADELIIPQGISCCGFAGRAGFQVPELNQAALSTLEAQIKSCDLGVTFNRNCQVGLSLHGKKEYLSLAEIILSAIK